MIKPGRMRWTGHIVRVGKKKNAYTLLVRKTLGRPICRWVNNIKVDLGEIGWGGMDWIDLAQDRDQ
jgi:hypothetical protein